MLLLASAARCVERHRLVAVAREQDPQAQARLDDSAFSWRATPSVDVLLERAAGPCAPGSSPPWPGSITMVRTPVTGPSKLGSGGTSAGSGAAGAAEAGVPGAALPPAPRMSITTRVLLASTGTSEARKLAKRGPSSRAMPGGVSTTRTALSRSLAGCAGTSASSASALKRSSRRPGSCTTACSVRGVMSTVTRWVPACSSLRTTTRGSETSPTSSIRVARRYSARVSSTSGRPRATKSSGTSHSRPCLTGGESDTRRPPEDTRPCIDITSVFPRRDTVSPPASVSSRTCNWKTGARSSSATISCPFAWRVATDTRPSRASRW